MKPENIANSVLSHTKIWLEKIIIGLNFCPFAKKEFVNDTIHYQVCSESKLKKALQALTLECQRLDKDESIETTLLVFSDGFKSFERYLDLVDYANDLIIELGYEGVFQLASFHPDYTFEGEDFSDPSNYTNRSPFPIIHIIREQSMAKVLKHYPDPESIPENNIELARNKGASFFEHFLKQLNREAD